MKIALLQTPVVTDKAQNLALAKAYVEEAAKAGADMAVLPEMFNCPYSNDYFAKYAEPAGGLSWNALSECARVNKICLVAGSIPESDGDQVYNTAFVFDGNGKQIAFHRKAHLFDIDVKGGQRFFESHTFSAGERITTFDFSGVTFGLCICFDFRFPELSRIMALKGAKAIIVPAAFNMTTGPAHWETMFRQRAVDDQTFTIGASPARDEKGVYVSYANSIVCSPWGTVLCRAGAEPCILYADIDFSEVESIRAQLPLLSARRTNLYQIKENRDENN